MTVADIIVICLYFVCVVGLGVGLRGKQRDAADYFTASGSFGAVLGPVLIGLSIAATLFSGISFVIYASTAYSDGAQIALAAVCFPIVWAVLRFWFLPRYLEAGGAHPYEILERRYGRGIRQVMSAMYIFMRIGWMGVLIYAPTLIILAATGLSEDWFWPLILTVGILSTIYTVIGGIRGVIVTDAVQMLVMILGLTFIVFYILGRLPASPAEIWALLQEQNRLDVFDFSFDMTKTLTFWSVVFGLATVNVGSFVADQMSLQRYLATGTARAAIRSFTINMWGSLIVILALVAVGLLVWVFFYFNPDPLLPSEADRVLPYFIAQKLPSGLAGLLLAAILAATMSSMTSGINALAGCITNDFIAPLRPGASGVDLLWVGRGVSLLVGLLATLVGGLAGRAGSLLEVSQVALGLFIAPMLAVMVLAVNGVGARPWLLLLGLAAGVAVGWGIAQSSWGALWVAPFSFVIAYLIPRAGGSAPGPASG